MTPMNVERRVQRRGFITVIRKSMLMVFYNPFTEKWSVEEYERNNTHTRVLWRRINDFRFERRWNIVNRVRFKFIVMTLKVKRVLR